jgi:chromosome segregation protein
MEFGGAAAPVMEDQPPMRLKSLHLVGFKSFADRTEIGLDAQLTAIVGPNGCGKSNIVDAVRWTLGEQSAKQLRGAEMADVIFGGTDSRKPTGYAEVSLLVSNEDRRLPVDYDEVVITRRLYRSGESEYLLNKEPVRLRDIRQLLMGTGMGMNAYSIIEQGKVDLLLSAGAKERRVVFEEAAGISLFKAQRHECELKLDRTEQNLLRVGDIIEEVEKQLRSVKYQAAKARRYQEYAARLKELRARLSLGDYADLVRSMEEAERTLAEVTAAADSADAARRQLVQQTDALEAELTHLDGQLHAADSAVVELTGRITTAEGAAEHYADSAQRLDRQAQDHDQRQADARRQHDAAQARRQELDSALADLQQRLLRCHETMAQAEAQLAALAADVDRQARDSEAAKDQAIEVLRQVSRVQNDLGAVAGLERTLSAQHERQAARRDQLAARRTHEEADVERLRAAEQDLALRLAAARDRQARIAQDRAEAGAALREAEARLAAQRQEHSALAGRRSGLADLEARLAGVGEAVKRLLARAQGTPGVHGLIADLIRVPREYAAAVEAVLGDLADCLLVDTRRLAVALAAEARDPKDGAADDRVGFLCRDGVRPIITEPVAAPSSDPAAAHPAALGRVMDVIDAQPAARAALATVLNGTVIVRDLETALAAASNGLSSRRVVTLAGDVIAPDGTLLAGSRSAASVSGNAPVPAAAQAGAAPSPAIGGRIWRRAEIQHLTERLAALDQDLARCEAEVSDVRARLQAIDAAAQDAARAADQLHQERNRTAHELERQVREVKGLADEIALLTSEIAAADDDLAEARTRHAALIDRQTELEARHQRLEAEIAERETALAARRRETAERRDALTRIQVEAADAKARRAETERNLRAADEALALWQSTCEKAADAAARARAEADDARRAAEDARTRLAQLRLDREQAAQQRAALAAQRQALADRRAALIAQRDRVAAERDQLNARRQDLLVRTGELRVKGEDLVQRTRDELGMDLAAMLAQTASQAASPADAGAPQAASPGDAESPGAAPVAGRPGLEQASPGDRAWEDLDAIRAEIADLREKIERLGGVNLEAIQELDQLEIRATFLNNQRDDLTKAKTDLENVIRKINKQCREMFQTTFDQVREQFRDLFRKLFGGGQADVFLVPEEGQEVDVLESGIEIIARPPGKEPRALSLLSGGEKVMTAVALLLAVFRSNPSPFCILDEVDAALDESAIGRFAAVLREFLDKSQFIIVTHNKRMMSVADTLYGVTMPEAGVSRVMTVRLEEVQARAAESRVA